MKPAAVGCPRVVAVLGAVTALTNTAVRMELHKAFNLFEVYKGFSMSEIDLFSTVYILSSLVIDLFNN